MTKQMNPRWWWLLPLFLLVMLLVTPRLDWDGPWYDELFSIGNAGGAPNTEPLGIDGIYQRVMEEDPYQALGYPYLLALWGGLVGWTELADRVLSLLLGLLAIAFTYRLGLTARDARTGFCAALILGVSSFFILYAHEIRAFTLMAALSAYFLWNYALLVHPHKSSGWVHQVGFVIGGAGLLWAHYAAAMLLIGVGIYHLLFVKKDRRWFVAVGLAVIVSLLFLPQMPAFLEGYGRYTPDSVEKAPLSASGVLLTLEYFFSNGLLALTLPLLLVGAWLSREQIRLRLVVLVAALSIAVLVLSNEALDILEPPRLRYATFLWPPVAVWVGAGMAFAGEWLARRSEKRAVMALAALLLPLFWLGNGLRAYGDPNFTALIQGDEVPRLRGAAQVLAQEAAPDDLFAFYNSTTDEAWYIRLGIEYMTYDLPLPSMFTASLFDPYNESNRAWAASRIAEAERIWYGINRTIELDAVHDDFLAYIEADFVHCGNYINQADISLDLYARSSAWCDDEQPDAQFADQFALLGSAVQHTGDTLDVALGWQVAADVPVETYSAGLYVIESGTSDGLVAQTDQGLEVDSFEATQLSLDLSNLAAGSYDVWLAVYEWQTGRRLSLANGENLYALTTITIEEKE